MKVLILGGGVIGVTSAYYLAKAGHAVTVIDRQPGAGLETSFANAGQVSFGYSSPWAGPGVPVKAIKWLLMRHRPFVLWPRPDAHLASWLVKMLANCTEQAYHVNKSRMVRVADYSRVALTELRTETGITYDHRERGTLQIFRKQKQVDAVLDDIAVLKEYGVPFETLDVAGCVAAEPALEHVRNKIVGGLRLPDDETGDAHLFTQRLTAICADRGVTFHFGVAIQSLQVEAGRIAGVDTDQGLETADAYVVAMGSHTPTLVRPLGIDLPVYPVKGYSITVPIAEPDLAPVSTVMDETYKVGITRLGNRIRVGGTAELAGYSTALRGPRRATLEHSVADLFPRGGDLSKAVFWTGLRPMTPDGTPVIGATAYPNLWLNTGHGTLGWTMSCGSGRLISDLISGHEPEIKSDDLSLSRYTGARASANAIT